MGRKLFGEYLVEKGIITEETLADILIDQIKALPSVAEVLHEKKIVKAAQLLEMIKYQMEKKVDLVGAGKALGIWSTEIAQEVEQSVAQARVPLALLLIKKGLVALDQVTSAFDDFLSHLEEPSKNTPLSILTDEKRSLLTQFAEKVSPNAMSPEDLQKVCEELRLVRSGIQQDSLQGLESLVASYQEVLECWMRKGAVSLGDDISGRLKIVADGVVGFLWSAKDLLSSGKSEQEFLAEATTKKKFDNLLGTAQVLSFDIDTNVIGVN